MREGVIYKIMRTTENIITVIVCLLTLLNLVGAYEDLTKLYYGSVTDFDIEFAHSNMDDYETWESHFKVETWAFIVYGLALLLSVVWSFMKKNNRPLLWTRRLMILGLTTWTISNFLITWQRGY